MNIWLNEHSWLPKFQIQLHKRIPLNSGLGGGSSDLASFVLHCLKYPLELSVKEKILDKALSISTDTFFFIQESTGLITGKGDAFREANIDIKGHYILLLFPKVHVSTKEAYSKINIDSSKRNQWNLLGRDVKQWKSGIYNDFEELLSCEYPIYSQLKKALYDQEALFVSLTGSGSVLYAIFKEKKALSNDISAVRSRWIEL